MNKTQTITTIILAAGEGKRMYSKTPKVLHKICGKTMLEHVMDCARKATEGEPVVVIGHGSDIVREALPYISYVLQTEQLGTGHAVLQAENYIGDDEVLVLCGDTPLLRKETIIEMISFHRESLNSATILTTLMENPFGYGRIVRNSENKSLVDSIIEEKDAEDDIKKIKEINSGILIFDGNELKTALKSLGNDNAQGEYYLTDVIEIIRKKGLNIGAYISKDQSEIMGVNNRAQLSEAEDIMNRRIVTEHMMNGVTIKNPATVYIGTDVKIGKDTIILPNCIIEGKSVIGEDCLIGPNTRLTDMNIDRDVQIEYSVATESSVGEGTTIGPFAYLRPGNKIGRFAKIGDFVEVKNSTVGDFSKASHLTYIGDGDVGNNVNLGCGTVFVNYDGVKKYRTTVEDDVFVGCNSNLIAPVNIGTGAYVAAGTTVTKDVPNGSLVIGRARQEIKEEYAIKFKKKKS